MGIRASGDERCLDARGAVGVAVAAVPRAAVASGGTVDGGPAVAVDPVDTEDGGNEPAQGREEGKGDVCLPGRAGADTAGPEAGADARPVEDVAAAVVEVVDEQAEGDEPHDGDEEVGRVVDEAAREGEQPDDGEDDGQAGDNLGVYEASLVPRVDAAERVQVGTRQACDDGSEGQLLGSRVSLASSSSWRKKDLPPLGGESWRTSR